jgi:hypothetical protein
MVIVDTTVVNVARVIMLPGPSTQREATAMADGLDESRAGCRVQCSAAAQAALP